MQLQCFKLIKSTYNYYGYKNSNKYGNKYKIKTRNTLEFFITFEIWRVCCDTSNVYFLETKKILYKKLINYNIQYKQ